MSRNLAGIFLSIVIIVLVFFLDRPVGPAPAIGRFFSPTHGFWHNTTFREFNNTSFELDCIKGKATVIYDSLDIPHIFADTEEDLLYAQGYVEAQNRLWQMDFITHFAAGRLCEIVGDKALELDRFNRRIGLTRAAKISEAEAMKNETSKMVLESFSAGVNAYIDQLSGRDLPIEYKLLGYKPEKWSPYKCALLMKYMAKDLTYYDTDIEHTNALRLFGKEIYDKLYPEYPSPEDPIIPVGTKWNFKPADTSVSSLNENQQAILYPNPYKDLLSPNFLGSNNWAVSGAKTASGKPILCNDPHLQLNLPSIWISMQLHCKDLNVMGVTLPGAPGIIIGFNDNIAWGVTNSERDVINTFSVEYKDANKTAYKLGNGYENFTYDVEVIKIKGGKDFVDSVRMTKVGAVVYDEHFGQIPDQKHLAVYWRAEDPSNDLLTFYYLNHAKNHADYLNALQYFACPGQNFVYADKDNNIAIRQQGYFMLRTQQGDGSFVTPLADVDLKRLREKIPVEQNPYILNPERGFVSSANQKPVDKTYPYLTNGVYENYRNRVINNVLENSSDIKARDMMNLQGNNLSLLAKETLPAMLAYLNKAEYPDPLAQKILKGLENWNYYNDPQKEAPSYFYNWFGQVADLAWDEFQVKNISLTEPQNYVLASLLVNDPKFKLFDIAKTDTVETAKEVVAMAFQNTVNYFKEYQKRHKYFFWKDYKNTTVQHLARIDAFSVSNIDIGGWNNCVNAASDYFGPSWRMVVDFKSGKPTAYGIYPGGQSGNPASKNYSNMIPVWENNNYYPLGFYKSVAEAKKGIK